MARQVNSVLSGLEVHARRAGSSSSTSRSSAPQTCVGELDSNRARARQPCHTLHRSVPTPICAVGGAAVSPWLTSSVWAFGAPASILSPAYRVLLRPSSVMPAVQVAIPKLPEPRLGWHR
jgi:hypothetical protein